MKRITEEADEVEVILSGRVNGRLLWPSLASVQWHEELKVKVNAWVGGSQIVRD
jgi:hypothetical protein